MKELPIFIALEKLQSFGFSVKLNQHRTNIIFERCIFCGNPNWNLELEVDSKFVFNCWACGESGGLPKLFTLLNIDPSFLLDFIPKEHKTRVSEASEEAKIFWRYEEVDDEDAEMALYALGMNKSSKMKIISPQNPIRLGSFQVSLGVMLLGERSEGIMLVDFLTRQSRKYGSDLYVYSPISRLETKRLGIVEGFLDLWPFVSIESIVLGSTYVAKTVQETFLEKIKSYKEIYLMLDKGAEEKMLAFLLKNWKDGSDKILYVLEPSEHSPSESETIYLKEVF